MKTTRFLAAGLFFVALACLTYWLHVTFLPVNVIFYTAIADSVVAAAVTATLVWRLKPFRIFNGFEKFQMLLIWLLTGYALAISVPTVLDRSLSFYILEKLQQRGGGIQESRFAEVFTHEYVNEYRLVDVRLTEQLESGTITIEDGCVRLTPKGDRLASFNRFFRTYFLPKQRLLMGQYTDDLKDPFKHSSAQVTYTCK